MIGRPTNIECTNCGYGPSNLSELIEFNDIEDLVTPKECPKCNSLRHKVMWVGYS